MSNAICNVIVGFPMTHRISNFLSDAAVETEDIGFIELYSSHSFKKGYCGVLICKFSEYDNKKVSDLKLTPTPQQIEKATELMEVARNKIKFLLTENEDIKEWIKEYDDLLECIPKKPDVFLVWSNS